MNFFCQFLLVLCGNFLLELRSEKLEWEGQLILFVILQISFLRKVYASRVKNSSKARSTLTMSFLLQDLDVNETPTNQAMMGAFSQFSL